MLDSSFKDEYVRSMQGLYYRAARLEKEEFGPRLSFHVWFLDFHRSFIGMSYMRLSVLYLKRA